MIRYFICESCHQGYEADDNLDTNCPYCKSDNVRPARKSSGATKYVAMALLFAVCCVLGYFIPSRFEKKPSPDHTSPAASVSEPVTVTPIVTETTKASSVPEITEVSVPALKGETYAFNVTVKVPSGDKFKVYLMSEFGSDPLYVSTDGSFKNVAPIDGGVYKIVAENQHTQDRSVEKFVSGCLPIQKIVQLTSAEMQTAFNSGSIPTKDFMSRFTMAPKINVVGMEEGEPQVTSVGEVFNRIGSGLWTSVVVSDVKYAVDNRVNSFTISVTY